MPKIIILYLAGWLTLLAAVDQVHAQTVITGNVVNATTGEPLQGAHVYLSGTKIGTATGASGRYRLRQIPPGGHRLVVSMIGYSTQLTDVIIGPGDSRDMDFELKSVVYTLPEIYVGERDDDWKKNLQRFSDHFIGQSQWADSVKILNPGALRFDRTWWGRLSAEARAPLRIENRALGYSITYYLEEFNHSGGRTRWDGEPLFSEMIPADSAQAAYWKRNRRKAFNGSLRHFLLALLADSVREEGFDMYNEREAVYGFSSKDLSPISAGHLISEGDEAYLYRMNFSDLLQVIYRNEGEEQDFIRWQHGDRRNPRDVQTSYLELNEHPITVDTDGEIIQPYGATQFGYFAYSRLAYLTPRGYRPEGYQEHSDKN